MVEEGLNKKSKQKPFQLRDINTGAAHGQQEVPAASSGQYLTLDWWSQLPPAGAQQSAPIVGTLAFVLSFSWGEAMKCQRETKQHVAHKRQLFFLWLIHGGQVGGHSGKPLSYSVRKSLVESLCFSETEKCLHPISLSLSLSL